MISETKPVKPMREAMPGVTAFIDAMRASFGADAITQAMRSGAKDGRNGCGNSFWAVEGDHMIGNPWSHWPRTGPCLPPTKASAAADASRDAKPLRRAA